MKSYSSIMVKLGGRPEHSHTHCISLAEHSPNHMMCVEKRMHSWRRPRESRWRWREPWYQTQKGPYPGQQWRKGWLWGDGKTDHLKEELYKAKFSLSPVLSFWKLRWDIKWKIVLYSRAEGLQTIKPRIGRNSALMRVLSKWILPFSKETCLAGIWGLA